MSAFRRSARRCRSRLASQPLSEQMAYRLGTPGPRTRLGFDPTIQIGTVLSILWMTGAAIVIAAGFHWRIKNVETKLDAMASVLETLARQDERLRSHDQAIDDLKHGRGFIFEQPSFGGGGTFPPTRYTPTG